MGKGIFIIVIIVLTIFLIILIIQYIPRIGVGNATDLSGGNVGRNEADHPMAEFDYEEKKPDREVQGQLSEVQEQQHEMQEEQGEVQEQQSSCHAFEAGMNLLVYGHPDRERARLMFERLRQLNVNHVAIAFPVFQESLHSAQVEERSSSTPTEDELQSLIEEAHAVDLCVMLRPILDEQSFMSTGKWRGDIEPTDVDAWFLSYRSLLMKYANIAEENDIASFNIGTELSSMERYDQQWRQVIEEVRDVYHGEIIYSFNWDRIKKLPSIPFVNLLDHIGLDIYFPLDVEDGADQVTLEKVWEEVIRTIKPYLKNRSIVITETGMIPLAGAYRQPFAWSRVEGKLDRSAQTNYYEATYRAWQPLVNGLYWWAVTLDQNPEVIDYSPLGSPTEMLIARLFSEHAP